MPHTLVIEAHAVVYANRLATYPAWPELAELLDCAECDVPTTARPRLTSERA